jgi:hypothetical protein
MYAFGVVLPCRPRAAAAPAAAPRIAAAATAYAENIETLLLRCFS